MIYNTYKVGGEIYHHGISGMHWGVRNGPPYPIEKSRKQLLNNMDSVVEFVQNAQKTKSSGQVSLFA
jgi:hypothetical protein